MTEPALGKYRGRPVISVVSKTTNTGDGLSAALGIEPVIYEVGREVTIVHRTEVAAHRYRFTSEEQGYVLEITFKAYSGMVIDDDLVAVAMDKMDERIQAAKDEAAGQHTLPAMDAGTGRRSNLAAVGQA